MTITTVLIPEHFLYPEKSPMPISNQSPFPLSPLPLATTGLLSMSMDLPLLRISYERTTQREAVCVPLFHGACFPGSSALQPVQVMEAWDLELLAILKFENAPPTSNFIICNVGDSMRYSTHCPAANSQWVLAGRLPL